MAGDEKSKPSEDKIKWKSILTGAAIAVMVSMIVWYFQQRAPILFHEAGESQPVPSTSGESRLYLSRLENTGNKEAEDVNWTVRIPNCQLQEPHIDKLRSLNATTKITGDTLQLDFKLLNPGEVVQITLPASGKESMPSRADVTSRARGVIGTLKNSGNPPPNTFATWFTTLSYLMAGPIAVLAMMSLYSMGEWIRERVRVQTSIVQVEVKIIDDNLVKVQVLKGIWQPKGWITLHNTDKHSGTKIMGREFREYGSGKHTVQVRQY